MLTCNVRMETGMARQISSHRLEKGVSTLTISLLLLVAASMMVLYAAKQGVMEQRISANDYRYKEAFSRASGGMDRFLYDLRNNPNPADAASAYSLAVDTNGDTAPNYRYDPAGFCTDVAGEEDCGVRLIGVDMDADGDADVFTVEARGISDDRTGTVTVSQQIVGGANAPGGPPAAPVIVRGTVGTGGNYNVAANPYGGGATCDMPGGVPLPISIWSKDDTTLNASSATCDQGGFNGTMCSSQVNSDNTTEADDVVDVADGSPFPDDVFEYITGTPLSRYAEVKAGAKKIEVSADCDNLNANSTGIYWVTVDCSYNANSQLGSAAAPVIVIVDEVDITLNAGSDLYGILFNFNKPAPGTNVPADATAIGEVTLNGNAVIHGALVANASTSGKLNGTFAVDYDKDVLCNMNSGAASLGFGIGTVLGSWRDFGSWP